MAQRLQVLIAEDDDCCAAFYSRALDRLGWPSVVVSSAQEARLACQLNEFDLLIADVLLFPDQSGWQVAAQVQQVFPSLKTLFVSGSPIAELKRRGLLPDAFHDASCAFLLKPFTANQLRARISELVGEHGTAAVARYDSNGARASAAFG
jgi:DNA-binding NtrC family response regulator